MSISKQWMIGLSSVALTFLIMFWNPPFFKRLEFIYQNMHFDWRGPKSPSGETVIVVIDEKSIDKIGKWPWPREVFARLVDRLTELNVKAIGFDIVFSSPGDNEAFVALNKTQKEFKNYFSDNHPLQQHLQKQIDNADQDKKLSSSLQASERVVLGYFFHFNKDEIKHVSRQDIQQGFSDIVKDRFRGFIKQKGGIEPKDLPLRFARAVESNIPLLSQSAKRSGFFSFEIEEDGSIRKQPLMVKFQNPKNQKPYFFPSLAISMLETYLDGTLILKTGPGGIDKVLINAKNSLVIPTNSQGETMINFLGPKQTFSHISVADILQEKDDRSLREKLEGKMVLVGATATALQDIRLTPFDSAYPGVEIHATLLDNLLNGETLSTPEWAPLFEKIYIVLLALVFVLIFSNSLPLLSVLSWGFFLVLHWEVSHWLFVDKNILLSGVPVLFESTLIYSLLLAYRFLFADKQKRSIQDAFGHYLSPSVVEKLLEKPDSLKLGGEEKELTALFTDLAGFTSFSETMSAEEQVNHLNAYLGEMTDILLYHNGTLDKYDGDAIKAFFGAPFYFSNHAEKACLVAIEMQERLDSLRAKWVQEGKPPLRMRVGVNTRRILVGNMGSKKRMNYGMNGDAVNLAARLEGVNKVYQTESIISESTFLQAQDSIEARKLDHITVVGRSKPVWIYELLGKKGQVENKAIETKKSYERGLDLYFNSEWDTAIEVFRETLRINPEDAPSLTLIDRCLEFRENPPQKDWRGIYTVSAK